MKRMLIPALIFGVLAGSALAQDTPAEPQRRVRERGAGGPPPGEDGPRGGMQGMAQRLARQLQLDEQQQAQFDEIVAQHSEKMEEMGKRWQEIREAMRSGDQERADQLRAEMRAGNPMTELMDAIEPILREDQVERLHEMRDNMDRGARGQGDWREIEGLAKRLNLDDKQKTQFDEILQAEREQGRSRWEEIGPLFRDMRAAEAAGDDAKADELRKQLEEMRGGGGDRSLIERIAEKLEPILTDEQKPLLAEAIEQARERGRGERGGDDLRGLFRAARRLELEDDQKEALREMEQEVGRAARRLGRDREALALLVAQTKKEIADLLDDEQKVRFEQLAAESERGERGRGERGRGERGERGRERGEPRRGGDDPTRP